MKFIAMLIVGAISLAIALAWYGGFIGFIPFVLAEAVCLLVEWLISEHLD
jgi:hypothetical protein